MRLFVPVYGKYFLTLLAGILLLTSALQVASAQSKKPELGFAGSQTITNSGSAEVELLLEIPGGSSISALQFDVTTSDVSLQSVTTGDDLDDFEVEYREIASGVTRVIAYAEDDKLKSGTYDGVLTLNVTATSAGTITLSNLIGAEDSDFGDDANLQAGITTHTIVLELVGDANGDYEVDLSDVAQEIDALFDPNITGADVHPWDDPDGQIDVRDLLILIRAVLADEWPDGSSLNISDAGKTGASAATASGSQILLESSSLSLDTVEPIKVLMITVHGATETDFEADDAFEGSVVTGIHRATGALRLMFYRMDGASLPLGSTTLGALTAPVSRLEAEAVTMSGEKITLEAGITMVGMEDDPELPEAVLLMQNYPNPFNPTTQFELEVREAQHIQVEIFDVTGQKVAMLYDGMIPAAARMTFPLDATGLSSGQYVYRVMGERFLASKIMTLVK